MSTVKPRNPYGMDNTPGVSLPRPEPRPGNPYAPNYRITEHYTPNPGNPYSPPPPPAAPPPAPPPAAPPPATTTPPPGGGGAPIGGNQGVGGLGSSPSNPNQNMQDFARNNLSGKGIWDVIKDLPDAYKFAVFNALEGTGGNYDPNSGWKGQNDLWGTVLHEQFGGNHDQMNQWKNYWLGTNPSSRVHFDPSKGTFGWVDTGHDLSQKWMYQNQFNDFWKQQGTGNWMTKNLSDFGINWNPSGMSKIGQAPWYQPSNDAVVGNAPFGMNPQPNVTPSMSGTIYPNDGRSSGYNNDRSSGYNTGLDTTQPATKPNPTDLRGPGTTVGNAPVLNQDTSGGQNSVRENPYNPSSTAPGNIAPTNPYANNPNSGYRFKHPGWLVK